MLHRTECKSEFQQLNSTSVKQDLWAMTELVWEFQPHYHPMVCPSTFKPLVSSLGKDFN